MEWYDVQVRQDWMKIEHVQFLITPHTHIRASQTVRLDRMELAASIHATNSDDCFAGVVYLIWDHH